MDYELSSWKYQGQLDEVSLSPYAKYIAGRLPLPENSGIVIKQGSIIHDRAEKGSGSAYGGKWRPNPNKAQDLALIGAPNSVQRIFLSTKNSGYWIVVKYDETGHASIVRHETVHTPNGLHSNPHDHILEWVGVDYHPEYVETINYFDGNAPEMKGFIKEAPMMENDNYQEVNRFHTIFEFKQCMNHGGEAVITWNGEEYFLWGEHGKVRITCPGRPELDAIYDSAEDALEYMVGNDRLREVISKVIILDRWL